MIPQLHLRFARAHSSCSFRSLDVSLDCTALRPALGSYLSCRQDEAAGERGLLIDLGRFVEWRR
jgi:hypothetical protein